MLVLFPFNVVAAIIIGNNGQPNSDNNNTKTLSIDVGTSDDRLLLVGVARNTNDTVSSVTYDGVAMTLLDAITNSTDTNFEIRVYYTKDPTSGSNDVVVTMTASSTSWRYGAIAFSGVDQTTTFTDTEKDEATGVDTFTINATTTNANELLVGFMGHNTNVGGITAGAGQTSLTMFNGGLGFQRGTSKSIVSAGAASLKVDGTAAETQEYVGVITALNPATEPITNGEIFFGWW